MEGMNALNRDSRFSSSLQTSFLRIPGFIAQYRILMTTSPGPGLGNGAVSTFNGETCFPTSHAARLV